MAYTDKNKLRVVYGDYTLGVHGEGFDYIFSYSQGGLESIVKNGYEWLYRCPKPTFWRALTDNDRGSRFHIKSGSWLASDMFIDCKKTEVIMDGELQKQYDLFVKNLRVTAKTMMYKEGCILSIAELYDSKPPYLPKGAFSQAWSVAEIFRIILDSKTEEEEGK